MAATERLANLGYFGLKVEATAGTAVTPTDYIPLYQEDISTKLNLVEDNPIAGIGFVRYQNLQGQRGHNGTFTVMAEPNTTGKLFNMLMTVGNSSGSNPTTWPFTTGTTTKSYTVDIGIGTQVFRYFGAYLEQISPAWQGNEMHLQCNLSALGSFGGRQLSGTPTGTNPWTINLDTTYDPSPTTGLVVGDIMTLFKADGTTVNFAVATIPTATSITTTTADPTSGAVGDWISLRPATPSFTSRTPFLWSKSEYRFGTTASAALSATHTPLEVGSDWTVINKFENTEGSKRSGSFDPASLPRLQYDAQFKLKKFFDTPADYQKWASITKQACVIRHFSEGSTYELRLTFNDLKARTTAKPKLNSATIAYTEMEFAPQYSTSDSQAIDVKVISAINTL